MTVDAVYRLGEGRIHRVVFVEGVGETEIDVRRVLLRARRDEKVRKGCHARAQRQAAMCALRLAPESR